MARKPAHPAQRPSFETVQIGVRLEERLRRRLERAASQSGQSMNAEIVERLKRSFQSDEDKISLIARAIIDTYPDIANRIEELFAEAGLWRQVHQGTWQLPFPEKEDKKRMRGHIRERSPGDGPSGASETKDLSAVQRPPAATKDKEPK